MMDWGESESSEGGWLGIFLFAATAVLAWFALDAINAWFIESAL